nr:hypothetical protein CFP56_54353 [Quercus suber]
MAAACLYFGGRWVRGQHEVSTNVRRYSYYHGARRGRGFCISRTYHTFLIPSKIDRGRLEGYLYPWITKTRLGMPSPLVLTRCKILYPPIDAIAFSLT